MVQILIAHKKKMLEPVLTDSVTLTRARKNEPSSLKFTCIKDSALKLTEGSAVRMHVDGKNVFFGFIFKISYKDKNQVEITAYDQLRYLKNKDSYLYTGKRADQLIRMIAKDFYLQVGELEDTKYIIPKKAEDNKTLFDIIQGALEDTLTNDSKMYVLYDDFGKLTLKNVSKMKTNVFINNETAQSVSYSSSIDGETYNRIKLAYDDKQTGTRKTVVLPDKDTIAQWGVLQYYEKVKNNVGMEAKAKSLLNLYNSPTRELKVNGAFGNVNVRGGSLVAVYLELPDMTIQNYMMVEKVTHKFESGLHTMDLTLRGGAINA